MYCVFQQAATSNPDVCRHPVLLVGEPGLQKRSIAALVHYASIEQHKHPVVGLDANTMGKDCGALLGRGGHTGLLEWLGNGTLILSNTQQVREHKLRATLLGRDCGTLLAWGRLLPWLGDSMLILSSTQQVREWGLEANIWAEL